MSSHHNTAHEHSDSCSHNNAHEHSDSCNHDGAAHNHSNHSHSTTTGSSLNHDHNHNHQEDCSKSSTSKDANDYSRFDSVDDSDDEPVKDSTTKQVEKLPLQDALYKANISKDKGNESFKSNDYVNAIIAYDAGISALENNINGTSNDAVQQLLISFYNNRAMTLYKQNNYKDTIASCNKSLAFDQKNIKSLFRRACSYNRMSRYEESKEDLLAIIQLDATNSAAKKELADVNKNIKDDKSKQKALYGNLFSKTGATSIYDDKEKEMKQKARMIEEEQMRLQDDYTKAKLDRRTRGLEEQTFEVWKKEKEDIAKEEEKERKEMEEMEEVEQKKAITSKSSSSSSSKSSSSKSSSSGSSLAKDDNDTEYDEDESKIIEETKKKGYCYFKKEQSTDIKALIGDITPKVIGESSASSSATTAVGAVDDSATMAKGSSAWNYAGTFEEKDMTVLVKDRLTAVLNDAQCVYEDDKATVTVVSVKDKMKAEGEAQIIHSRGKRRSLYDYNVTIAFHVSVARKDLIDSDAVLDKKAKTVYSGSISIPEFSNEMNIDDIKISYKRALASDDRDVVNKAVEMYRQDVNRQWKLLDDEYKCM